MIERVIIHIGRHKTGSSSIQRALAENSAALRESGVFYPTVFGVNHSRLMISAFHPSPTKINGGAGGEPEQAMRNWSAGMLETMRAQAAERPTHTIVMSGENGSILPEAGVREFKRRLDEMFAVERYVIVMYARHPIARAVSSIQQNVKGNGMRLDDAVRLQRIGRMQSYRQIVEAYTAVFGEDAMAVRAYEKAKRCPGGLLQDFASVCGIAFDKTPDGRANERIATEIVHFMSSLYEVDPDERNANTWNRRSRVALTKTDRQVLFGLRGGGTPDYLDEADRDRVWSVHAEDMAFLAAEFGIHYTRDTPIEDEPAVPLFGDAFVEQCERAMPLLSAPVRREFAAFLQGRGRDAPGPP
jgi:hypothetical protein